MPTTLPALKGAAVVSLHRWNRRHLNWKRTELRCHKLHRLPVSCWKAPHRASALADGRRQQDVTQRVRIAQAMPSVRCVGQRRNADLHEACHRSLRIGNWNHVTAAVVGKVQRHRYKPRIQLRRPCRAWVIRTLEQYVVDEQQRQGAVLLRDSSRHVYNTTVPTTCLPHTGFAGVWTPATHAELNSDRTITYTRI